MRGGKRFFLDANAIILLLKGNKRIEQILEKGEWIGTSVICYLEFNSFPNSSDLIVAKIN